MLARPELQATFVRLTVEWAMGVLVARHRFEEIVAAARISWFVGLLRVKACVGEVAVREARRDGVADDRADRRPTHEELAARMPDRPDDGFGRNLGLKNGRDRLRLPR